MAPAISLPTSSSQGSSPPCDLPQVATRLTKNTEPCAVSICARLRNRLCSLRMCKKCCTSRPTECSVTSHNAAKQQVSHFTPNLPSEITSLPTNRGSILVDEDPTIQHFHADEKQRNLENQQRQIEEEREQNEDAVLAAAIALDGSPIPSAPPLQSLAAVAASSIPPSTIPLPPLESVSLVRVPSSSKRQPTITNHLDSNWRRAYNDRSKEAQTSKGKAQGNTAILQKNFIMLWQEVCFYQWVQYQILTRVVARSSPQCAFCSSGIHMANVDNRELFSDPRQAGSRVL